MTDSEPLMLSGAPGSPYTRKMLAVLRYRRIPYRFMVGDMCLRPGEVLPEAKVQLAPTFYLPDEQGVLEAVVDSTPIIRELEQRVLGRSVIPTDAALKFLDYLLEDYGDEWLTKAMFHYRWYYQADTDRAGDILPRWRSLTSSEEELAPRISYITQRQISRLYVVGSNDTTAPVIEESYARFLKLFRAHLQNGPFLFGQRPASADFAHFGQLTQLAAFDPTPMALTLDTASQVYAWVSVVEDLSGLEPAEDQWFDRSDIPVSLRNLFSEIGKTYVPVMLANAAAVDDQAELVETQVDGATWQQQPFPYQAKALQWVRQEHARLDGADREFVDEFLEGTGCEALFRKPLRAR